MPEVGDIVTVILWDGEDQGRALEVMEARREPTQRERLSGLHNTRIIQDACGDWLVVADAVRYRP